MRNSYEAPEILQAGRAQDIVLGQKPEKDQVDAILGPGFRAQEVNDMDESDD